MNLYKLLNYPEYSRDFLNIEFGYKDLRVFVTGHIEITMKNYIVPYDGNLLSGGYTEMEVDTFNLKIYNIYIFDHEGSQLINNRLEDKILTEIKNETRI